MIKRLKQRQMKKCILLFLVLLFMKSGWTQNTNLEYKYAFKIYNLTTYDEYERSRKITDTSSNQVDYTTTTLQILHPTIAFQWKTKKNNFHEVELTSFILGKLVTKTEYKDDTTNNGQSESGFDLVTTAISARYEYILNFNKSKESKFVPSLGFGINPYYRQNNYSPEISSSFPISEIYLGVKVFITPRLTYYLSSKIFIDVNIPICFFDIYFLSEKENNPAVPIQEQTINTFNLNGFPKVYSGRIGVGLKL
jgi:hypothetical protein